MTDPNSVFTNRRYIPPTQSELIALLTHKNELQSKLDGTTAALMLMVQQYNEAIALLEVSTSTLESITESIVEDAQ